MNGLTVIEQLELVAQQAQAECQAALMWLCLVALAAFAVALTVCAAKNAVSKVCRMLMWLGPVGFALCLPGIVCLFCYGSTKPPAHIWRFEYANGVSDNGSHCTNDLICASWTYSLAAMEFTLRAAYQDLTVTNAAGQCTDPLHQLPDALVRDGSHVWEVPNATNMRVVVYAQYVPPPAVHTNGVYHLNGVMQTMDGVPCKFVTPGVRIQVNIENGDTEIITPTNRPPAAPSLQSANPQEENQE